MLGQVQVVLEQVSHNYQTNMIQNKKGGALMWIIIIVVLMLIGVGVYFWLSGDAGSAISAGTNAGSSIPQPPALPSG